MGELRKVIRPALLAILGLALAAGAYVRPGVDGRCENRAGGFSGDAQTPWGDPDLQGVWTTQTTTPLERPAKYADRAQLSDDRSRGTAA
jgi:hypothetical protein